MRNTQSASSKAYLEPKTRSLPLNYPISVASTRATICRVSFSRPVFHPNLLPRIVYPVPRHAICSARTHARSRKVSELFGTPAFHLLLILLCIPGLRARLEPVADHGRDKPACRRLVACLALPSTKRTNHFSSEGKQTNRGEKALCGIFTSRQPRHRALSKQGTKSRFASSVCLSVRLSVCLDPPTTCWGKASSQSTSNQTWACHPSNPSAVGVAFPRIHL